MINLSKKILFIHVPKTGGSTINHFLSSELFKEKDNDPLHQKKPFLNIHSTYKDFLKKYKDYDLESFFKFTCVRNPYDRALSAYLYFQYAIKKRKLHYSELKFLSFEDFLTLGPNDTSGFELKIKDKFAECKDFSFIHRHFKNIVKEPQCYFLKDHNDNINFDYIMRFENYQQDFLNLCRKLSININEVPHRNQNTSKTSFNYTDYYNDKTRNVVSKMYEEDIDIFKYSF